MKILAHQRCFNHVAREAVARCPECGQCFCRECITEHDDRVVCAVCLQKLARRPAAGHSVFAVFFRLFQCLTGVFIAWFFFFLVGDRLSKLPAAFHEQTLWKANWIDEP